MNRYLLSFISLILFLSTLPSGGTELKSENYQLELKGEKTFRFEYRKLEGAYDGFIPGFLREENLNLELTGNIGNKTKINGAFQDVESQEGIETSYLNINNPFYEVELGRFETSLNNAALVMPRKMIDGAHLKIRPGDFTFTGIASKSRNFPKLERFFYIGAGEYKLSASPVVYGSESIRLEAETLRRIVDYQMNYVDGSFVLTPSFISRAELLGIDESNQLTVMYEYEDIGQNPAIGAFQAAWTPDEDRSIAVSGLWTNKDSSLFIGGFNIVESPQHHR